MEMFFVFSRFLPPKKQKTEPHGLRGAKESHRAIVSRVLCFFCFLEVLATFGQKPKKNIEKTKKTQTMWGQGV